MKQKIEELRRWLNYHNRKYYIDNAPEVSDYEFDTMLRELQDLEALHPEMADPNSPTMRVGSDLTNKFRSISHAYPMLSLSNTYSLEELHEWIGKVRAEVGDNVEFCCELKFDGINRLLSYPEFYDMDRLRDMLALFEKKDDLLEVLSEETTHTPDDRVQVYIGRENIVKVMDNSTLIFKAVRDHGKTVGAIGIVGPTRMDYRRVIATIDHLTRGVSEVLGDPNGNDGADGNE